MHLTVGVYRWAVLVSCENILILFELINDQITFCFKHFITMSSYLVKPCMYVCTFLPKDPSLVHAGGEKDGRLGDTHEEVCEGQVYYKQVGRCPQGPAPTHTCTHTKQSIVHFFVHLVYSISFMSVRKSASLCNANSPIACVYKKRNIVEFRV